MLDWKTRQVNDIETNPLDCYWAIGMIRKFPRLYRIVEQYPIDKNGVIIGSEPELYVLFEALDGRPRWDVFEGERQLKEWEQSSVWGDYFFKDRGAFVRAYKTLDEAKERAELQLSNIKQIMDAYLPENNEN